MAEEFDPPDASVDTMDDAALSREDDAVYETVVRGYRVLPTDETTGFAETIVVADEARGFTSTADVLSTAVGVQVRRLGGPGSYSAASIRGSTSAQVPIYLDGVLLNASGFPTVDLGDLSLDTLESLEIYRGSSPVSLGAGGIGGAISLTTRRFEEPATEMSASYGSWNTARLMLLRGDRLGEVDGLALLSVQGSEGDFEYLNRNGTLFNDDDDRIQRRQNNQHIAYAGLLKLDGEIASWGWTVMDDFFAKRQGVAGIDSVPTDDAELRTLRNATALRLRRSFLGKHELSLGADCLVLREDFDDTENEVGVGHRHTVADSSAIGGDVALEIKPTSRHRTEARVDTHLDRFSEEEFVADRNAEPSKRVRVGLGLQHEWHPLSALYVVPTFRLDWHRARYGGGPIPGTVRTMGARSSDALFWSPSLGARWEAVPGLTLRANAGRYVRPPDLSELFGDRGAVVGNPELESEVGVNADAGFTYLLENRRLVSLLRVDAAWFGSWTRDLIAYVQNSQNTIRPENVDSARILGAEIGLQLLLGGLVTLEGNYTYLNGINLSDKPFHNGRHLPGRPEHEAYGKAEVGRVFDRWGGAVWFDADYAGRSYLDQANLKEDSLARLLFGVGCRVELPRAGLSLTVEVKNLLDQIIARDEAGRLRPLRDYEAFPLPGRTVMATLHWKT